MTLKKRAGILSLCDFSCSEIEKYLQPLREEMLLEDIDEGSWGQHVLPLHHPVPLIQTLTKWIDHLQKNHHCIKPRLQPSMASQQLI